MKDSIDIFTEFFPSSNFKNQLFYLYCPSLQGHERSKIYESIIKHHGVSQKKHYIKYIYYSRSIFIHLIQRQ